MKPALQKKTHTGRPHVLRYRGGVRALLAAMSIAIVVAAGASDVFMLPPSNRLWRTAPSDCFEVPVFLPAGASSAMLVVTGNGYRREYAGLADGMFPLSLPAADSADAENVYELELTFNDSAATTRHATLAVVRGASSSGMAEADVRTAGSYKWSDVASKAVLAIPSGVDAMSVNGQAVDASLWQSPGWFLLASQVGSTYDVSLTAGGNPLAEAILRGVLAGFSIIFR